MTSFTRKQGDKRRVRPRRKPPDILRKGHKHVDKRPLDEEDERTAISRQLTEMEEPSEPEVEEDQVVREVSESWYDLEWDEPSFGDYADDYGSDWEDQ